jgi:hypothetical protein
MEPLKLCYSQKNCRHSLQATKRSVTFKGSFHFEVFAGVTIAVVFVNGIIMIVNIFVVIIDVDIVAISVAIIIENFVLVIVIVLLLLLLLSLLMLLLFFLMFWCYSFYPWWHWCCSSYCCCFYCIFSLLLSYCTISSLDLRYVHCLDQSLTWCQYMLILKQFLSIDATWNDVKMK